MIIVIGSGPAGVACAAALLQRGASVTMLDVGLELEEEKKDILNTFQTEWHPHLLQQTQQTLTLKNPQKRSYNSDYPYRLVKDYYPIASHRSVQCASSFAAGGLSTVWGAFAQFYSEQDLANWPITFKQLNPYYQKIRSLMPIAYAQENGPEQNNTYTLSAQAKLIYERCSQNKADLEQKGIQFATADLAVHFKDCRYCGNCQHGCPLQLIYSSTHTLESLKANPRFEYLANHVVLNLSESENRVEIVYVQHPQQEKKALHAKHVFLACGPIISTALTLRALNAFNAPIAFLNSSHFMLPALMQPSLSLKPSQMLHTLAQLYLRVESKEHLVNLQLYTYMDFYSQKLKKIFRPNEFFHACIRYFEKRMLVLQGHLHSDHSHSFTLQVKPNKLQLVPRFNKHTHATIKTSIAKLVREQTLLGFKPLRFLLQETKIGKSFHYGGAMPMHTEPKPFQTDIYGRPFSLQRIHLVDASVFPSIAAGSITPTIMANAYRIGTECPLYADS